MLATNKLNGYPAQAVIRCELIDSDSASALGIEIHSSAPILALCRKLLEVGHDPGLPMECWRGDVLCLHVRSIGEAAGLRVNTKGTGFIRAVAVPIAPLVAPMENSDPEAAKAAKNKLSRTAQWMLDHPNDEPCPTGPPGDYQAHRAARIWRKKRGIIPEPAARKQRAKYEAAMGRAP